MCQTQAGPEFREWWDKQPKFVQEATCARCGSHYAYLTTHGTIHCDSCQLKEEGERVRQEEEARIAAGGVYIVSYQETCDTCGADDVMLNSDGTTFCDTCIRRELYETDPEFRQHVDNLNAMFTWSIDRVTGVWMPIHEPPDRN
jgi:uncharacterized Zn finger protein (UPF0148 family)